MAAKDRADVFEFYGNALKSWSDIFGFWTKTLGSSPMSFGPGDMQSWFKPFWGYVQDWGKIYASFTDMPRSMPPSFASVKDLNEVMAKAVHAYMNIYDAWFENTAKIAKAGYEVGQKAGSGEEVDVDQFFNALREAYDTVTTGVVAALKDSPFAGIKEIDQAVKKSLDSFPEEQEMAREFFKALFDMGVQMMNFSVSSMREAAKTLTDMVDKGNISTDSYRGMMVSYRDLSKQSLEILGLPASFLPGYRHALNEATNWVEKGFDVSMSWLEIYLKSFQGIIKSAEETNRLAGDVLKGGGSMDEFVRDWAGFSENTMRTLIENTQLFTSIPDFINSNTELMRSTNKLYRSMLTLPHAFSRADLDTIAEKLGKVKSMVDETMAQL